MRRVAVLVLLMLAFSAGARAGSLEVQRVYAFIQAGDRGRVEGCPDCRVLETSDPVRGSERVAVSSGHVQTIPFEAIRAVLAFERTAAGHHSYRLVIFVDGPTQPGLGRIRGGENTVDTLMSIAGTERVGWLSARSPWRVDVGFFESAEELKEMFAGGPAIQFLPEYQDGVAPGKPTSCTDVVSDWSGEASRGLLFVDGMIEGGLKHGLWVTVDEMGDLIRVDVFARGCLVATVPPAEDDDTRRMKEVLNELEKSGND